MTAFLKQLGHRINSTAWEPCSLYVGGLGDRLTARYVVNGHGIAGVGQRKDGAFDAWMWQASESGGGRGCWIGKLATEDEAKAAVVGAVSLAARCWFTCARCGVYEDHTAWTHGDKLRASERCINYDFWEDWQRKAAKNPDYFVAEGNAYSIGKEPTPERLREASSCFGYSGSLFRVRFNDGRTVATHNLWHQGIVPERFRAEMPDTAAFLTDKEPAA